MHCGIHCSGSLRRAGIGGDTGRLVAGRSGKQQWLPYSGGILDMQKQKKHFTLVLKSTEEWSLTEHTAEGLVPVVTLVG